MSLTFVTKKYTCNSCGKSGSVISAIKRLVDIELMFPTESRPTQLSENRIYVEVINRDEYGIISERKAVEARCEHCNSDVYEAEKKMNMENVLNFYNPSTSEQWFRGFARHE